MARVCEACGSNIPWRVIENGEARGVGPRKHCLECRPLGIAKRGLDRGKKVCRNCQKEFKTRQVIDGEKRDLGNRNYCLECVPFGVVNNKKIELVRKDGLKTCTKCKRDLPLDAFGKRPNRNNILNPRCFECERNSRNAVRLDAKRRAVDYLGGACDCGYDRCLNALDFHHVDPATKSFSVGEQLVKGFSDEIRRELDKCKLVCRNCHAEEHAKPEHFILKPPTSPEVAD